jgi:DNA-binding NtrC family response regulator
VLQDGTFARVGGEEILETNVRVIAATNRDLKKMCDDNQFRTDLYYRLNVFPLYIPPLRDRIEDLPILVGQLLHQLNRHHGKDIHDVDPQIMEAFRAYPWPGNIRELENLLERAYLLETTPVLRAESFPAELFAPVGRMTHYVPDRTQTLADARARAVEQTEKIYLVELLAAHHGKIQATADAAGISTRQLHKLMKKYGIRKEEFKARATLLQE